MLPKDWYWYQKTNYIMIFRDITYGESKGPWLIPWDIQWNSETFIDTQELSLAPRDSNDIHDTKVLLPFTCKSVCTLRQTTLEESYAVLVKIDSSRFMLLICMYNSRIWWLMSCTCLISSPQVEDYTVNFRKNSADKHKVSWAITFPSWHRYLFFHSKKFLSNTRLWS